MAWNPADEWLVRRTFNPITRTDDVILARRRPPGSDEPVPVIVAITTGTAVTTEVDPLAAPEQPLELRFPEGVLEALAETVKPGPSLAEVRRIEESLAVERARVERLLASAVATLERYTAHLPS